MSWGKDGWRIRSLWSLRNEIREERENMTFLFYHCFASLWFLFVCLFCYRVSDETDRIASDEAEGEIWICFHHLHCPGRS